MVQNHASIVYHHNRVKFKTFVYSVIHFKFVNSSAEGVSYDWFIINLAALF